MYQIKIGDDVVIHQSGSLDPDFLATSATLSWEVNRSGTLEFTLPPNNYALNLNPPVLVKLKNEVIVTRNGKWLWSGRIMDITKNFYNQVTFKCEGWLSVLCDSIIRPDDNIKVALTSETIPTEITRLIDIHNQEMEVSKKFTLKLLGFDEEDGSSGDSTPSTPATQTPVLRNIHEIALEVIEGLWGNGNDRITRLTNAGYNYETVQAEVNRIISEGEVVLYSSEDDLLGAGESDTPSSEDGTSNTPSASEVIAAAEEYLGATTGDANHHEIIDGYNTYYPKSYTMTYNDPWCDAFLSWIFIKLNCVSLLGGVSASVEEHIAYFKNRGIWLGLDNVTPQAGDIICFDWDDDAYIFDHIGLVKSVEGTTITTVEGNHGDPGQVAYGSYQTDSTNIYGYARPQYGSGGSSSDSTYEDTGSYYQTLDYIMQEFVNNEDIGGMLWCEGHTLIYQSDEYGETHKDPNAQPIEFGVNLLDFTHYTDASEVYTCLIPEGKDGLLLNGKKRSSSSGSKGSTNATLYGIDTAFRSIDFSQVDKSKIEVIITGVTQINNAPDQGFEHTYQGCIDNGIYIGAYKYTYASSVAEARTEAEVIVNALNGRKLDWPIFYDLEEEYNPNIPALGSETILAMIEAFRSVVESAGYMFGIYCNKNWYDNYIPEAAKKYDFWVASWPPSSIDDGTIQEKYKPVNVNNLVGWQYSEKGSIAIEGGSILDDCDMDVFYKNYATDSSSSDSSIHYDPSVPDWIENEAGINLFGKIFRQETFEDAEDVNTLNVMATERLNKAIIEATTIEISAFDLSLLDFDTSQIKLGTYVPLYPPPIHRLDDAMAFYCSSMQIDLCDPGRSTYSFGANLKTLTSRYNRLLNGLTSGVKGVTNYYISESTNNARAEIPYSITADRISLNSISFYRRGDTVYLNFECVFKKKVGSNSSIIVFVETFAPESSRSATAYDVTSVPNVAYRVMVTVDGQVLIVQQKEIEKDHIVTVNMSWEVKDEQKEDKSKETTTETTTETEGGD